MSRGNIQFPEPTGGPVDVLFIAGEHSGDQHAAEIVRDVLAHHPGWRLAALGGRNLQRAGAQLLLDLTRVSVVGLVEVLRHYGEFKGIFEALIEWVDRHRPSVVVMVDYPGFNLRFAEALRKRGISRKGGGDVAVYQYVSPQIWAWKARRRFRMAEILDELGVIFPFEVDCYEDTDLPVHFVGHPFARPAYRNPLTADAMGPVLLLPGSRSQAVSRIFPVMLKAFRSYREGGGTRSCICLYPDNDIRNLLEAEISRQELSPDLVSLRAVETGASAGVVLTSSGTMSLNCALAGIPGVIVYRAHPLTAWIGRRLIRIEWLGIANLVLGRPLYPEFIQSKADPALLGDRLLGLAGNTEAMESHAAGARELQEKLRQEAGTTVGERIEALRG